MNITDIIIRRVFHDEPHLRAIASIVIDNCLAIHDIKLIEGNKGFFIAMPNRQLNDGKYIDIVHPMNREVRDYLFEGIYDAYISEIANLHLNQNEEN